jgi:hypothetical protein
MTPEQIKVMTNDVVKKRLRAMLVGNLQPSLLGRRAADLIEELEERLKAATDDAKEAEAYAEELEAKLAKAVEALEGWLDVYTHCTIEDGACCCGDDMKNHSSPKHSNHMPLDHGAFVAGKLAKQTEAILAELSSVSCANLKGDSDD